MPPPERMEPRFHIAAMIDPVLLRSSAPSLATLSDRVLRRIAMAASMRRFAARTILYRDGEPPRALFFVLSGRVRVTRQLESSAQLLHHEEAGGVLGEIPIFGSGPYPASAVAAEPTRCAVLAVADVERLLREEPEFARFALRRIAERARVILARLDDLTSRTVSARLAAHLIDRARDTGATELSLGMSQTALADELGTAREVIVRALRTLCDAGAIRRSGRARFAVVSRTRLQALALPHRRSD
jgi:CRP/FNR family cyclic AMP-dependent transcriptional regulator